MALISYSINREVDRLRHYINGEQKGKLQDHFRKEGAKEMLTGLIDKYIKGHKETLDLLSRPAWLEIIEMGKKEVVKEIKGRSLDELED